MKKKLYSGICLWCFVIITLCACGKQNQENPIVSPDREETISTDVSDGELMVKINDKLYYGTGKESSAVGRCGNMDGQIMSTVDSSEIPTENNQSNFGAGFGYQYGADDTIEIYMNEKWYVFEYREE